VKARAVPLALALVAGCGRVGYDPLATMASAADGGPRAADGAAPAACQVAAPPDFCSTVPALPQAPVIDGVVECGLALRPVGTQWSGPSPAPTDHHAEYAVAWRPDGLYFFVRVTGPGRLPAPSADGSYCGDSVELFVHRDGKPTMPPKYDDPGTGQFVIAAPPTDTAPSRRADFYVMTHRPWTATSYGAFPFPGGYTVEAFFTGADLGLAAWSLAAGGTVGLDVSFNVSWPDSRPSACGIRWGQFVLHQTGTGCPGMPACDVGAFCTARLTP
jgi:hypothetical protein